MLLSPMLHRTSLLHIGTLHQPTVQYKRKEVERMKDITTHLYVDSHERTLILHSLVELKNALIRQGRYTDCIDELIFKVVNAPVKRMKIKYV